jgi:hypothetical protein
MQTEPAELDKISSIKQKYEIKASETKDDFACLQELIEEQQTNINILIIKLKRSKNNSKKSN